MNWLTISQACDVCTALCLSFWLVKAIRSMLGAQRYSVSLVIIAHFIFCGLPAILNLLIGRPIYLLFSEFAKLTDPTIEIVYCVYACACPFLWWLLGRSPVKSSSLPIKPGSLAGGLFDRLQPVFYALAVSPLLLLCAAPDLNFYRTYGAVIASAMNDQMISFQSSMSVATLLSVLAITCIWVSCRNLWWAVPIWLPALAAAVWLNGKRYIILLGLSMTILVLWQRRTFQGWKLAGVVVFAATAFGYYSFSYQVDLRSNNLLSAAEQYEEFRIDYGREHGIKYAIYAELHPEVGGILQYRGQSVLFNLLTFIPRTQWPDKPWPYAVYATAADLGVSAESLGWGITTSWLEEAIANFSWLGLLVGPLTIAAICRIGDSRPSLPNYLLTIIVSCLLLAVQLSAFAPLAAAWALSILAWRRPVLSLPLLVPEAEVYDAADIIGRNRLCAS